MNLVKVIINRIRSKLLKKRLIKLSPGFWSKEIPTFKKRFLFDLSLETEHMGDQLFFIMSFYQFDHKEEFYFLIDKKWEELWKAFEMNYLILDKDSQMDISSFCVVISMRSFVESEYKEKDSSSFIFYDFTDHSLRMPLSKIIRKFFQIKDVLGQPKDIKSSVFQIEKDIGGSKFILFNDYIYSRPFMRGVLIKSFKEVLDDRKNQGIKVIYVGSKEDRRLKDYYVEEIDYDFRGKLSMKDLVSLINSTNCEGYIGFDNALMHLALIFKKPTYIKFRGKFKKASRKSHYESINCASGEYSKLLITYLN